MIRKKYNSLFVFDLETTGLSFRNDSIIELGALYYELNKATNKYELISEIDHFVKIYRPIPKEIVELTHITDDMLNNYGIDLDDMFNNIKQYIKEDTLIIGYNVGFDYAFLNQVFLKFTGNPLKNDLLDVLAMYKDRYSYPHRLCDAILKFNVSIPNSHRAIDDVKATFEVLKELIKIDNDMICYVNKLGYNPKYPVYNKIPNCKYIPQRGANFEIKNDK